ncbi:L-asparaginase [Aduncisulcus paluster]|uniref:asparaginase n=1 Tax=Aduncisulcus paluster TaxID=2918883 RepID=A0ABQ5JS28_9EUKA|nr:L-asparaginase [Aduncisulcus paluster]
MAFDPIVLPDGPYSKFKRNDGLKTSDRSIYIAYTGGTIGMKKTDDGYVPEPGYLEEVMSNIPNFSADDMPSYTINEYDPLLDSSQMNPSNWMQIAYDIFNVYHDYDGFVVIHGTDTMAFTASALSFLLENLDKPVVVTGSQIPLAETFNDGVFNLLGAIQLAADYSIPEVMLYFDHHAMRGNRTQKLSAWDLDAFESGFFPNLVTQCVTTLVRDDLILDPPTGTFAVTADVSDINVVLIHLYPGISGDFVERALDDSTIEGAVILAYGTGNGPVGDDDFMSALTDANNRGVVLVDATQTHQGLVNLDEYGASLKDAGCVSAKDMTAEAALAKLIYLLAKGYSIDYVKDMIPQNMIGELGSV